MRKLCLKSLLLVTVSFLTCAQSEASYHRALEEEGRRQYASSSSEMSFVPFGLTPSRALSASPSMTHSSFESESDPSKLLLSGTRLNSLPPEILGLIARYIEEKQIIKLQKLTGDRALEMKMHELSFYQNNDRIMVFDLEGRKFSGIVEHFLKEAPAGANIRLTLLRGYNVLDKFLPYFDRVINLKLRYMNFGDDGVKALVQSSNMQNLTSLDLHWNSIGADGAVALATSATLGGLTSLNLWGNNIGAAGAIALATSATLGSLTSLNLEENNIGADGAIALASSPTLKNLTSLKLKYNNLDDVRKEIIKKRYPFAQF